MTLYLAYGSNLNKGQMARRCPKAVPLKTLYLADWKLRFNGVATIEPCEGNMVAAGLWRITPECEKALDLYEGVKQGLYTKEYFTLDSDRVLVYIMKKCDMEIPSVSYYKTIEKGFKDFGIPVQLLKEAKDEAYKYHVKNFLKKEKWYDYY